MKFAFPDNKTIHNNTVRNYTRLESGEIAYSDIDIQNPKDNIIEIEGTDYFFTYLQGALPGNKGGNSIILNLYLAMNIDVDDINYEEPDLVLKISRFRKARKIEWAKRPEKRFIQEVEALKDCQIKNFQNVISIFKSGTCLIRNLQSNLFDEHHFYTMEFAKYDLKKYIESKHSTLSTYEKLSLCRSLAEGIKELYSLGYYHRDIKPDNIFMVGDIWKIGDLGLIDERDGINSLDNTGEFIGPKGWLSPEAMNKYLCEGKSFSYKHNCKIDHQSDIFQLGKVFWYIFQHNAPIGEVKESDFYIKNSAIFMLLKTMLRYSKKSRYKDIDEVIRILKRLDDKLLRSAA